MRRLLIVASVAGLLASAGAIPAAADNTSTQVPTTCDQLGPNGQMPVCVSTGNGQWQVTYAGTGGGIPGWFVLLAIVGVGGGIAITIWRVSMARKLAASAGLSPGAATAVTLLGDPGLDAVYVGAALRGQAASSQAPGPTGAVPLAPAEPAPAGPASEPPARSAADRLRELQGLRDQSLVTADEYETRRRAIVDSV